jgi:hypothetical protein
MKSSEFLHGFFAQKSAAQGDLSETTLMTARAIAVPDESKNVPG